MANGSAVRRPRDERVLGGERRDETGMMSDVGETYDEVKAPLESAVVGTLTLGCAVGGGRWQCSTVSLGTNNPHAKTESTVF